MKVPQTSYPYSKVAVNKYTDLKGEVWVDVVGYEGLYKVSNLGRVKSLRRQNSAGRNIGEVIMNQNITKLGYCRIMLQKEGKQKIYFVHVLVATAFLERIHNRGQVNHKDCDKLNNNIENLEWCTRSENMQHAIKNGAFKQVGEKCFFAKLTGKEALDIYRSNKPMKIIAKEYNVSIGAVSQIKTGRRWRSVTGAVWNK